METLERIGLVVCFAVWFAAWGGLTLAYQLWQAIN
jgi:hypothetical protein